MSKLQFFVCDWLFLLEHFGLGLGVLRKEWTARMDGWYWKPRRQYVIKPSHSAPLPTDRLLGTRNYHTRFLPVVLAAFMAAFCGRGKVRNSKNAGAPCPPIAPLRPLGLLVACVSYPMLHLKSVHAKRGPSKMAAQCGVKASKSRHQFV